MLRSIFIAFLSVGLVVSSLFAQESQGQSLEKAGKLREALAAYVEELQAAPYDEELRKKIIQIAQKLDPPPAIPQEAKRFMVRGETFFKEAKSEADFTEAIGEFEQALQAAPWLPAGYFNLGLAQEGAGYYDQAINSFELYLLASPAAEDAEKVREKIYALEAKWEKAGRQAAEEQRAAEAASPERLSGIWKDQYTQWNVTVTGDRIVIGKPGNTTSQWYEGTVSGSNIAGYRLQDFSWCRNGRLLKDPMTGIVSADGRTLTLHASGEGPYEIGANDTIARWFHYEDNTTLTKVE